MKPLILFDIDRTLFDNPTFLQEYTYPAFEEFLDVSRESLQESMVAYQSTLEKNTDFDPEGLFAFLAAEYEVEVKSLRHLFFRHECFERSVFPDVAKVLPQLKKRYQLGAFTEAVIEWQQKKLQLSGLIQYFDPELVFISRRKTESVFLESLPSAVIVDDKPEVVEAVAGTDYFQPVWINRIDSAHHAFIPTIHTLTELETVLASQERND